MALDAAMPFDYESKMKDKIQKARDLPIQRSGGSRANPGPPQTHDRSGR